ncbi:hypothetical protein Tco_0247743 [Tanacetum coccineum]
MATKIKTWEISFLENHSAKLRVWKQEGPLYKEIDEVHKVSIIWNPVCVVVMLVQKPSNKEIIKESDIKSLGNVSFDDLSLGAEERYDKGYSDLESMPGDDIESLSGFEADESDHDDDIHPMYKEELTKDDEKVADNELSSLTSKVEQLESSLAQRVADKIKDSMPKMVAYALKDRLLELLSNTLKTILPDLLKDSVKTVLTVGAPKLIIKPLTKELIALNTLETNRMVDLQKKLTKATKAIHNKVGRVVQRSVQANVKSVRKEVTVVCELLKYCITMLDKADVNVRDLVDLIRELVILIDIEASSSKASPKGEKKAQGEPSTRQNTQIPEQTSTVLVVHSLEEKGLEEKPVEDEPLFKKLRFLVSNPNIPSPTSLKSLIPQGIRPPVVINMPLDQFTDSLFNTSSSKFSLTPPPIAEKEKSEKRLKDLFDEELEAQEAQLAAYEAKREKMLEEYNHYITFRAHQLAECKASASNEDALGAKHQRAVKDSLSAKPQRVPRTYSSQRHRQGSRRLLEDILVS